jgi:glycosyltransferase involved in cell wall biosynthesis
MRICLLSARFPPQRCGVGDYTYFLAGALARSGHDVDVLTAVGELDESLYPLQPNANIHRVISSWGTKGLPGVMRHVRKLDPHVLLIQYTPHAFDRRGITFAINVLPALLRVRGRIQVVTNLHEMYIPFARSLKRDLGALWQRAAALSLVAGSTRLSVTSTEWQRRLKRMGISKRIHVIPAGSNIPMATITKEDRARLRSQILGGTDRFLVASFGARHDRDLPAALYGLAQLKKERAAKLIWIGGGSLSEPDRIGIEQAMEREELTKHDIEWAPSLPHPEVSRLLSICDVMMLPFIDGVSTRRTSAVTALQHQLPLLTTRGSKEEPFFIHGRNVYSVPVGDRRALADGLVELARRPELRAHLAQGSRESYKTHFAWDVIAQQVTRLAEQQ